MGLMCVLISWLRVLFKLHRIKSPFRFHGVVCGAAEISTGASGAGALLAYCLAVCCLLQTRRDSQLVFVFPALLAPSSLHS